MRLGGAVHNKYTASIVSAVEMRGGGCTLRLVCTQRCLICTMLETLLRSSLNPLLEVSIHWGIQEDNHTNLLLSIGTVEQRPLV